MRINNNLMAINTHRQLAINTVSASSVMEKLSSGLRINRSKDDAAGIAISEKMRAQIRGLSQASRNAQDSISLIQTAEGGMQETHMLLQRMRELAVQSANDIHTDTDRAAIQNEIIQLTDEIDAIAEHTEFNTRKILRRGGDPVAPATALTEEDIVVSNLKKWWLEEAENLVQSSYGITAPSISMDVVVFDDPANQAAALVKASFTADGANTIGAVGITGKGMNLSLEINLAASRPVSGTLDGGTFPQYVARVIAHEMVHAVMMTTMNFADLPIWFNEGAAEFIHGADERLKFTMANSVPGFNPTNPAHLDAAVLNVVNDIGTGLDSDWAGGQGDYSAAYLAVRYLDWQIKHSGGNGGTVADSDGVKEVFDYLKANDTHTLDQALASLAAANKISFNSSAAWITAFKADVTDYASLTSKAGVVLDIDVVGTSFEPETDTGSYGGSDATSGANTAKNAEDIMPQTAGINAPEVEQPLSGFTLVWPVTQSADPTAESYMIGDQLKFQLGANENQSITYTLSDMRAKALGVRMGSDAISVNTHSNAAQAISIFNAAIETVSAERSKLGAVQNRLEHTINNLDSTSENLQAAESRIRDGDVAKLFMQYTKDNILAQAAQAMLAQANQVPQGVLQLLR